MAGERNAPPAFVPRYFDIPRVQQEHQQLTQRFLRVIAPVAGDLLYGGASADVGTFVTLTAGSAGKVLGISSGHPAWVDPSAYLTGTFVKVAGDTMTGPLVINDQSTDHIKIKVGDPNFDYAAAGFGVGAVLSIGGDFRGTGYSKDGIVVTGTFGSKHGSLGLIVLPTWVIEENNDLNAGAYFGAAAIDNTGAYTGYVFHALHCGGHPTVTGTIDTAIGFEVYDMDFATNYWAIRTGKGLVEFGDNVTVASGKVYKVNGTQVVSAQGAVVADASGGAVIDAEARTALNTLLARVRAHGLIAT